MYLSEFLSCVRRPVLLLAIVGMTAFATGCGGGAAYEGEKRLALSGKVTFDGQPVDGGSISFIPTNPKKKVSGGDIIKGEYKVPEAKGAHTGPHRVEIHWYRPTGKKIVDTDMGGTKDEVVEAIPPKYHMQSTLNAEVTEGKTTFDFELTSK